MIDSGQTRTYMPKIIQEGTRLYYSEFEKWSAHAQQVGYEVYRQSNTEWTAYQDNDDVKGRYLKVGNPPGGWLEVTDPRVLG